MYNPLWDQPEIVVNEVDYDEAEEEEEGGTEEEVKYEIDERIVNKWLKIYLLIQIIIFYWITSIRISIVRAMEREHKSVKWNIHTLHTYEYIIQERIEL